MDNFKVESIKAGDGLNYPTKGYIMNLNISIDKRFQFTM